MLEVTVKISVAPGEGYTDTESAVLRALAGTTAAEAAAAPAKATPAKATPAPDAAPKAAAKPKAAPKPKAEPVAEPVAEEPAEDEQSPEEEDTTPAVLEDDAPEEAEAASELSVSDALAVASPIISGEGDKGRARVKAALQNAGVARVSQLKGDAIAAFIAELKG